MQRRRSIAASLVLAIATAPGAAVARGPAEIVTAIAAQRLPLSQAGAGAYAGQGWNTLVEDAAGAQFTMFGEQHGSGSIADFAAALHKALASRGYTHSALEVGPFSTRYAEQLVRSGPGKLHAFIARPGNGFALPFLFFREEADMAEQMVAMSPDRTAALWGLDQEFVGGAPVHADLLQERARTAAQREVVTAFRTAAAANPMFAGTMGEPELAPLRLAFAMDPQALELIAALAASSAIYRPFVVRGGGDVHAANTSRETLMKRNFIAAFGDAERRLKSPPKVFLKFGANHAMRGHGGTDVPALGNFLAEWGTASGMRMVNLFVDCDGGEALNPRTNKPAPCEPYFGPDSALREATAAGPALQMYDLRPLRSRLAKWKTIDPASRKVILAFDYYVAIRGGRAAAPVGSPPASAN